MQIAVLVCCNDGEGVVFCLCLIEGCCLCVVMVFGRRVVMFGCRMLSLCYDGVGLWCLGVGGGSLCRVRVCEVCW